MPCNRTEDQLCTDTEHYWDRGTLDSYIGTLLGCELEWAGAHPTPDGQPRLRPLERNGAPISVHTLALTVGESFEPLLQVVCVLRPARLVLILNDTYSAASGERYGADMERLVRALPTAPDLPPQYCPTVGEIERVCLPADTPTDVFRALRVAMQKPAARPPRGQTNAVDITGAKKSMVVGAFLYAAHSNLPITYVDFDKYNTDYGKPYGYLCRIGQIANPYNAYRLRNWERIRQLYRRYDFRNVGAMLDDIVERMGGDLGDKSGHALYEAEEVAAANRLLALLRVYEAWDDGDYPEAQRRREKFDRPLPDDVVPLAITVFRGDWPSAHDKAGTELPVKAVLDKHLDLKYGQPARSASLFAQQDRVLVYAHDELAKISRLISCRKDYRSAYLRAVGLEEFLLKARLVLCWFERAGRSLCIVAGYPGAAAPSAMTEPHQGAFFKRLVDLGSARNMRRALREPPPLTPPGPSGERTIDGAGRAQRRPAVLILDAVSPRPGNGGARRGAAAEAPLQPGEMPLTLAVVGPPMRDYGQGNIVSARQDDLRGEAIHNFLYIPLNMARSAYELAGRAINDYETQWLDAGADTAAIADRAKLAHYKAPEWRRLCEKDVCNLDFLPLALRD